MSRRDLWVKLSERFDPFAYTPPQWRAARPRSPAAEILTLLEEPFAAETRFLVAGTIGTGKTTELLRIREARELKEMVVFLDLARYFDQRGNPEALQHVSQWEVCFLAGLTIAGAFTERYQQKLPEQLIARLAEAHQLAAKAAEMETSPSVDAAMSIATLLKVGAAIAGVAGANAAALAVLTAGTTVPEVIKNWNLPIGRRKKRISDDDDGAKSVLNCVNAIIGHIQSADVPGKPVLLVVDGLDLIRDAERGVELFVESNLLARLECRTVICAPYGLRHDVAYTGTRFRATTLVNEPVLDQHEPTRHGPGIAFFRELFERRTRDLNEANVIAPAQLDHLAYGSGGRARNFVKLVQASVQLAWRADSDTLTQDIIDAALDAERRQIEHGLHTGHVALLRAVRDDPQHRLPRDELTFELLLWSKLLPYPDGSEWFYPHPLLARFLA